MSEVIGSAPPRPATAAPAPRIGHVSATRRLLRRLRAIMAGSGGAQERLDRIVRVVAAEMVAEVCSAYVMRAGEVLELFATEGLRPEAVHRTRLRVGEGLVGGIAASARPLALADAQSHPDFAYRPETGEEIYHSLMGVPILRGGRVLGVLVVQNRTQRHYTEDEIEIVQTIAMIVAELIASGELVNPHEMAESRVGASLPMRLERASAQPGPGARPGGAARAERRDPPGRRRGRRGRAAAAARGGRGDAAGDRPAGRCEPRRSGRASTATSSKPIACSPPTAAGSARITEAVRSGLTAEAAVQKVRDDTKTPHDAGHRPVSARAALRSRGSRQPPAALSGRASARRRRAELPDRVHPGRARRWGRPSCSTTRIARIKGLVLEEGSPTSHVAIVARALDIPVVGRVAEATRPGRAGRHRRRRRRPRQRPDPAARRYPSRRSRPRSRPRTQRRADYETLRDIPAVTARRASRSSCCSMPACCSTWRSCAPPAPTGIGLFRTEIPLLVRNAFPDVADQTAFYRRVLRPVPASGRSSSARSTSAATRCCPTCAHGERRQPGDGLARDPHRARPSGDAAPAVAGAVARRRRARAASVMFPMIAEIAELEAARAAARHGARRAPRGGGESRRAARGSASCSKCPRCCGSCRRCCSASTSCRSAPTTCAQFLFACDRGNPRLADRYDMLSAPMLRPCSAGHAECGAAGDAAQQSAARWRGNPLEAMVLIGLGFRSALDGPAAIGPVKTMIRSLSREPLERFLLPLLEAPDHSLRPKLVDFARDHGVDI